MKQKYKGPEADLNAWLNGDTPPSQAALDFADRSLARATIQPGRSAIESARLAIAYEYDIELAEALESKP